MDTILNASSDDFHAEEKSSCVIRLTFTDEEGDAVIPQTGTWSLTDKDGTEINSRTDVAIAALSTTNDVLLSGDDLALQSGESGRQSVERIFLFEGTYNSATLGNNIPLKAQGKFWIDDLEAVS